MSKTRDLPPRCYLKHGAFFYVTPAGKWVNLGRDKDKALRAYTKMATAPGVLAVGTMSSLFDTAIPLICHGKADTTAKSYREAGVRLRAIFAEFRVEDVRPKHIAQFKVSMIDKPNMCNRMLTVLRLVFAFAVEQQLCEWNPTLGIKPYPEAKRTRLLTQQEIDRIVVHAGPRLAALILVLRITGQRIGDVLALRRSDLTEAGVQITQGKTGAKVLLRWTPDLRAAIDSALALHRNIKAVTVFHGKHGGAPGYQTVLKQWQKAVRLSGVADANIHDLRAVAITDSHRQGGNAQALAGHSRASMTERYIREKIGVEVTPPSVVRLSKKVSNSG